MVQRTDPADGRVIRILSEATDLSPDLDPSGPIAEPSGRPAADPTSPPAAEPPVDSDARALPEGTDRADGPAAIPVGSPGGRLIDAALDELASAAGPMLAGDSIAVAPVAFERVRPEGPSRWAESPGERRDWPSRLAAILLAAGWFGRGVRHSATRDRPDGAPNRRASGK